MASLTHGCDGSTCVKLASACRDTCLCVTVFFIDSTMSTANLTVLGGSFVELCFSKAVVDVRYVGTTCPQCNFIKKTFLPKASAGELKAISIYPNPVNNTLLFAGIQNYSNLRLVVTDLLGRRVLQQQVNASTIDISSLNSGTFIVELFRSGKRVSVQKIIK